MNCSHVLKNGNNCKLIVTQQIDGLDYCTRHYNVYKSIVKNNNTESKMEENYNEENYNNCQIDLYEEYKKIKKLNIKKIKTNTPNNSTIYNFKNINNIEIILNEINLKFESIDFINSKDEIYYYKILLNDTYFNLKIQNLQIENTKNIIYYEYLVLKELYNADYITQLCNICKPFYNKNNYYSILITELLYETLEDRKENNIITIDDIKEIIIQLIQIIQYIHNNKYLYIDLNPSNVMFVDKNSNKIKLANFSYCNKYINYRSEFLENIILNKPTGNLLFSSVSINKSFSGIRIDDIESILWILLYSLDSKLYIKLNKINSSNHKAIIRLKEKIVKENSLQNKCEYDFIKLFIDELQLYDNINNKKPYYNKFINIIKNA